ncbi:MAG: hypothetical protein JJ969_08380 [Rhizobiaceae bacterium]|nr:hypothetical protein [Rhizobiaceae bacterium]
MGLFAYVEKMRRHSTLMERMMDTLNVKEKLAELPHRGEVLRRASTRCMGCGESTSCSMWLEGHDEADEAPSYCRNHDLFARLTRQIEAETA